MANGSKIIHTDNQLHSGQFGKTAYTGWIPRHDHEPMKTTIHDQLFVLRKTVCYTLCYGK